MRGALSLSFLLSGLQLSLAVKVYLSPQRSLLSWNLSPEDASSALSRHLGVEIFEPLCDASVTDHEAGPFVGQGPHNALLVTMDEVDAKAVLPPLTKPSFELSTPVSAPISSLSSVVSTYLHRAQTSYSSVYNLETLWQLDDIDSLSKFFESAETSAFAAVEITELSRLRRIYGHTSEEYTQAAARIRNFFERAFDETNDLYVAILTHSSSSHVYAKRKADPQSSQAPLPPSHPPPQEPIGSISTCFTTVSACKNRTSSCSGRGQCVQASKSGRTCFICTCGVTRTGEGSQVKTEKWVGQGCEKKDVSGPFVLLAGTTIALIILVFGSISLLSSIGEHALPSTLMATAVSGKRD